MKTSTFFLCASLLLVCGSTDLFAQIALKRTIPGAPSFAPDQSTELGRMDFNGDGKPDMPLLEEEGISYYLKIIDGADSGNSWFLPDIGDEVALDFSRTQVVGFFELDGSNGTKEIVLAEKYGPRFFNPVVMDIEGNMLSDIKDGTSNTMLLTIDDMDGDVCEEVVVFNPQIPQVEVWGELKGKLGR